MLKSSPVSLNTNTFEGEKPENQPNILHNRFSQILGQRRATVIVQSNPGILLKVH